MFTVGVSGSFKATHFLTGDVPEEEKTTHSHPYRLQWEIKVDHLDEQGFSINIAHMEEVLDHILTEVSQRHLNELPYFQDLQTSIENLGQYLLFQLNTALIPFGYDPSRFFSSQVTVFENDHAWAKVEEQRKGN